MKALIWFTIDTHSYSIAFPVSHSSPKRKTTTNDDGKWAGEGNYVCIN